MRCALATLAKASRLATVVLSEVMVKACTLPTKDVAAAPTSLLRLMGTSTSSRPNCCAAARMALVWVTELASAGL